MDLIDIGPVFEAAGYAEVNRNILFHLRRLGVNIRIKPLPLGCTRVDLDPDTQAVLESMVRNVHITLGPALFVFLGGFFEREPGCHSIGLTMLETDRIPPDWVARCNLMDEIWVPSRFNRETFIASGVDETKVRSMPLGVDGSRFHPGLSPLPIPGRKGFAFLSVFEWIPRKGYDILLRAYLAEFRPDEDVCLVLKVHDNSAYDPGGSRIRAEIAALQQAAGKPAGPPVLVLPALMSPADMARLYAAADCFVLPTRGEGWNMTAIEAMACGVPAICTSWSSHLEFMTHDNSLLIDVEGLEPVPAFGIPNDRVYAGSRWARPSEAHLRTLMRWVYENRERAKEIGMRGCRDVLERFTWEKTVRLMYARLLEIENEIEGRRRSASRAAAGAGGPPGGSPFALPPVPGPEDRRYCDRRWNPKRRAVSKLDISITRDPSGNPRGSASSHLAGPFRPPRGARGPSPDAPPPAGSETWRAFCDARLSPQTLRSAGWKAVPVARTPAAGGVRERVAPKDAGWRGDFGDALPDSYTQGGAGAGAPATRRVARVLMVVPSWGRPCGISEYARALAEYLGHWGVEATVVTSASPEAILPLLGGSRSRMRGGNAEDKPRDMHERTQDTTGTDIVHFQYEFVLYDIAELSSTVAALRGAGVPVVATAHDFAPGFTRSNEFVARAFSHLIVHSHEARAEYCRVGADPARTTVIPMGCRNYSFDCEAPSVGARPAVGFFGFCLPHKGIVELAMAVREVRRTYPGLKCFVLSSIAPYHSSRTFAARLEETLARLGVSDDVTLIGDYLPEPEAVTILHAMDVNVLPYRDHGLIGTSAAARTVMAAQKPMIVTDVPFFSDLGAEVYKIPSAHPDEIAKGLRRLLGDPALCAELVRRMDDFLRRNHWSGIALKHAELYERILEEAAAGHGGSEV
ncbi:MAG: glycosyltransferase family 4 protein [Clostridia bacterium]